MATDNDNYNFKLVNVSDSETDIEKKIITLHNCMKYFKFHTLCIL